MTEFTTPVGRFVMGSLTVGQDKDAEGRPLLVKSGPDTGKPRLNYFFAIAIAKGAERHWAEAPWGATIWQVGHGAFPGGQAQSPLFAWKVEDGDSAVPNKAKVPVKNCDRVGFPGNWILKFSSGFAPSTFNSDGSAAIPAESIKPGYFIQVNSEVTGNESTSQPGVYLNHRKVALAGFGPEIVFAQDATAAGFGGAPLPAGASAVPLGGFAPPPAASIPQSQANGFDVPPATMSAPPAAMSAPPATMSAPPAPQFLQPPGAPVAPPAAPAHQMTALANGATYEQMIAAGWNDAQLVQHGMMAG